MYTYSLGISEMIIYMLATNFRHKKRIFLFDYSYSTSKRTKSNSSKWQKKLTTNKQSEGSSLLFKSLQELSYDLISRWPVVSIFINTPANQPHPLRNTNGGNRPLTS